MERAIRGMNADIMIQWFEEIFLPHKEEIKYLILNKTSFHISKRLNFMLHKIT